MNVLARHLLFGLLALSGAGHAAELHVGADREFPTLGAALTAAAAGDTLRLHGGKYAEGALVIATPLTLVGEGGPTIDGQGVGTVLTIKASDVTIRGVTIVHSARGSMEDHAAIRVADVHRVVLENNRIGDCAFGIFFSKSRDCAARDNVIEGNLARGADNGNGIHAWYCERLEVRGNQVSHQRDGIYFEFVSDTRIEGNSVTDCVRYGLHFMFSHRNRYRENVFSANGAGVAVMYSHEVEMTANRFAKSWGSASYGLLLKDIRDSAISGNTFAQNSIGITVQNSTRLLFEGNRFQANGWALQIQTTSTDNNYRRNNFVGNAFDLTASAQLTANRFEHNYWDKAELYDLNRDGIGDQGYRPLSLFSMLIDRVPSALLLLRSPLVHFLDRAERIFPSITPDSLCDERPAMRPFDTTLVSVSRL